MQTSDQINEIAAALAKAQATMAKAAKDSTNPHFRSKYADLASITDACREALTANAIAVIQAPSTTDDGAVAMTTRLAHSSGQWLETTMACRPMKPDAQAMGSVVSYLRRYCLAAMTGVVADDDDGNAASGHDMRPAAPQSPPQRRQPPKAPAQHSAPANGKARGGEASTQPNDAIPFGEDGGEVLYVNTQGRDTPLDLADAVSRLEKAAEATTSLPDEEFASLMNANAGWLTNRAPAALKALFNARNMDPADWLR